MNIHRLNGCAPTPLAHYLKALGVFRLVAAQADPEARAWWSGDSFFLAAELDYGELLRFFLERYAPTPLVSPWNKGSGFYYENDAALAAIEASIAARFRLLRDGVQAGREMLHELAAADQSVRAIKAESKRPALGRTQREALRRSEDYKKRLAEAERRFKSLKVGLIPQLKLAWRGAHREWLDVAVVLEDDLSARFPALLGTGGNDGRLDFTNNYFQRLNETFDFGQPDGTARREASQWFEQALFGQPGQVCVPGIAVGQFAPGGAGGANASNGPLGNSQLNPVDFVLALEGTILFAAGINRRLNSRQTGRAAAPFAAESRGAGYASASGSDENARGEQWMALWSQPLSLPELKRLLIEGRVQLGSRSVQEPLDFARAVARLGIARGISGFQRYGYIERNGQSNLAVPLGRILIPEHPSPRLSCLDDLDSWLPRLRREARAKNASARLLLTEHRLADALFGVTQHPDEPVRWQMVLMRLADVEAVQVTGSGYRAGPIPRLRPEWVQAADDGSAELRLALAFAMQAGGFNREGLPFDGVRRHWLPLKRGRFNVGGTGAQARLQIGPECVMRARDGLEDATSVVSRRLTEAAQQALRHLPLISARGAAASSVDIAEFIAGGLDADRILLLARALMALDASAWSRRPLPPRRRFVSQWPDDSWLAIRLAILPWPLPDGRRIGTDPAILRRLESGDASAAVELARQRLRAAGITTTVRASIVAPDTAKRWAAALAFPITQHMASVFARRLDPNTLQETVT